MDARIFSTGANDNGTKSDSVLQRTGSQKEYPWRDDAVPVPDGPDERPVGVLLQLEMGSASGWVSIPDWRKISDLHEWQASLVHS